jgi:UDP-N-acetylmuramoylalanine--D-glutamate ligase
MIDVTAFKDQTVAVMGLGKSGLSAARALSAGGANVWAWDDGEARRKEAQGAGVNLADLYEADWSKIETLVLSPGIPHTFPEPHAIAAKASENGAEIICDVDLLARTMLDARYVGISGTNGKSTTTALIGHILKTAGRPVEIGGNYGIPALELEPLTSDGAYVLELSSYQLERVPSIALDVAILLNITPDHLNRHGGMDGYVAAKKIIFDRAKDDGHAIIGMEDANCRGLSLEMMVSGAFQGGKNLTPISGSARVPGGVYVENGTLIDDLDYGQTKIMDVSGLATLPGGHNWQNAAAAYAAAKFAGIDAGTIAAALQSFAGLAHRQELIRTIGRVSYVNDSKGTNTEAASRALACYEHIHWIAGGEFKEDNLDALAEQLSRIDRAYLIGEAADTFAGLLQGEADLEICGDLATALEKAHENAQASGVRATVLLSPACASFDQFENFEARGDAFRQMVEVLS